MLPSPLPHLLTLPAVLHSPLSHRLTLPAVLHLPLPLPITLPAVLHSHLLHLLILPAVLPSTTCKTFDHEPVPNGRERCNQMEFAGVLLMHLHIRQCTQGSNDVHLVYDLVTTLLY